MPFYEFECKTCGTVTESLEKMHVERIPCPKCNPPGAERQMVYARRILSPTMTTFVFAGGRKK